MRSAADRVPVRAVLFDWGGTLSTYRPVDLLEMWRAAARVLAPDDPEPVATALLAAEDAWWERSTRAGDCSGTTEELVRSVAAETHLDVAGALAAYHGAWEPTVQHDPAAVPVLRGLRERGLRTGLLSNTHWPRDLHERWLADAGLLELLDVRLYTSDLAHMKPHPEAFAVLLREVGVPAGSSVFVGDRPRDDVWGAARGPPHGAAHRTARPTARRGAGRRPAGPRRAARGGRRLAVRQGGRHWRSGPVVRVRRQGER
ncbi:MAG: HAD family hydrolase, partial [Actinomycetota bacterium]|nr:HAD family hydrolase [Actinomycetota bacterium]